MPEFSFSRRNPDTNVSDLLAAAKAQLNLKPTTEKEFMQPCRRVLYYEFLGELNGGPIYHWFMPHDFLDPIWEDYDIVVHGHTEGNSCYASTFCHVLTYEPNGTEHPSFIKAFKRKWKNEEEVQSNPTGVPQQDGLSSITFD